MVKRTQVGLLIASCLLLGLAALAVFGLHHDRAVDTREVGIVNDLAYTVRISVCENASCTVTAPGSNVLQPGQNFRQNIDRNSRTSFLVRSSDGEGDAVHCVSLGVVDLIAGSYRLSALEGCR